MTRIKKRVDILACYFFIFTALYCPCARAQAARVSAAKGNVLIKKDASSYWQSCKINLILDKEAEVQTLSGAQCTLAFDEKKQNVITVKENSRVKIRNIMPGDVFLSEGRVFSLIKNIKQAGKFEVRTPTAVAGARGTGWITDYNQGQTAVSCLDDRVTVQGVDDSGNPTQEQDLSAGSRIDVAEGGSLGNLDNVREDDLREWNDFARTQDYTLADIRPNDGRPNNDNNNSANPANAPGDAANAPGDAANAPGDAANAPGDAANAPGDAANAANSSPNTGGNISDPGVENSDNRGYQNDSGFNNADTRGDQNGAGMNNSDNRGYQNDSGFNNTDNQGYQNDNGIDRADTTGFQNDSGFNNTDNQGYQNDNGIDRADTAGFQNDFGLNNTDNRNYQDNSGFDRADTGMFDNNRGIDTDISGLRDAVNDNSQDTQSQTQHEEQSDNNQNNDNVVEDNNNNNDNDNEDDSEGNNNYTPPNYP